MREGGESRCAMRGHGPGGLVCRAVVGEGGRVCRPWGLQVCEAAGGGQVRGCEEPGEWGV